MALPKEIPRCRISGSTNLITVLKLGDQALTGVFPKDKSSRVTSGPLELVWCPDSGLLQLKHSYDASDLYGSNYGYRSGLNQSMVKHLQQKVKQLQRLRQVQRGDIVLDIGSNDATLLRAYDVPGLRRIGIDPTAHKFASYYTDGIELVSEFFSEAAFRTKVPNERAKIITSIAMFYDLEDPGRFVNEVEKILDPDGIWHFEQSYMPTMLRMKAFDTVCHEHLEYYSLAVVKDLLENSGLRIIDVQMNSVNGGSFAVTAVKSEAKLRTNEALIDWLLDQEDRMGLYTPAPFRRFEEGVFEHRKNLVELIQALNASGKKVLGYGASTKGNVLLQFCGLTDRDISCIAEVNPDKFGAYTPGTRIPIVSEKDAMSMKPDYMLVLPWHFRNSVIEREQEYLATGGKLIFPLPEIEVV